MYFMEKIINKIKSNKKGEYSLYIEDEKLVINQDIYTDYFLYEGKKLNDDEYQEIKNKIEVSSAKVYVLNLLKQKMYSSYELKEKLFNIKKMSKDKIDILIDDLISKKLIDDKQYQKELYYEYDNKCYGYYKIENELYLKGLKTIFEYNEEHELAKCRQIVNHYVNKYSHYGIKKLKESVINSLVNLGYSFNMSLQVVNEIDFSFLEQDEISKIYQDYLKITIKYDEEEKNIKKDEIIDKLKRKGYRYCDIISMLEEYK